MRPSIHFPVEVINEEREISSIENKEALRSFLKECKGNQRGSNSKDCFSIVYPLSILFPDGTIVEVDDRKENKSALSA